MENNNIIMHDVGHVLNHQKWFQELPTDGGTTSGLTGVDPGVGFDVDGR